MFLKYKNNSIVNSGYSEQINIPSGVSYNTMKNDSSIIDIQIDSIGRTYIGGNFTTYSGITVNNLIRLNLDGSIDNTFNIGSNFNDYVTSIAIDNDDNLYVVGNFTTYSGITCNRIIKLKKDGTKDNTFNTNSGFSNLVRIIK